MREGPANPSGCEDGAPPPLAPKEAPMPALFEFREVVEHTLPVPILRTLRSAYAVDTPGAVRAARALAQRFGVTGDVEEDRTHLRVRGPEGELEIRRLSGGFRFREAEPPSLVRRTVDLDDDRAIALADTFLAGHGLRDVSTYFAGIERTRLACGDDDAPDSAHGTVAVHVDYAFSALGLEMVGPGARMRATLTRPDRVTELHRCFRTYELAGWKTPLPVEAALARFQADPCFSDLRPGDDSVVVERVFPGYYVAGSRPDQTLLVPAYVFRGYVSTPDVPRFGFTKPTVAVHLGQGELTSLGGALPA